MQITWTLHEAALAANTEAQIGPRLITGEPMYALLNLFMSDGFVPVDLANLVFPATMRIDWVRIVSDNQSYF